MVLVIGDEVKVMVLVDCYGIEYVYGYVDYDQLFFLGDIDVIYLVLFNDMYC